MIGFLIRVVAFIVAFILVSVSWEILPWPEDQTPASCVPRDKRRHEASLVPARSGLSPAGAVA